MKKHKELGLRGEKYAVEFLLNRGYEILFQNFRIQKSEIDIIASKDKILSFVEVKTRMNMDYRPELLLSESKKQAILRAAEAYKVMNNYEGEIYFELICVILNKEGVVEIEQYQDIFSEL